MHPLYSPGDIVSSKLCIGCGSCVAQSGLANTTMAFDHFGELKPTGTQDWMQHRSPGFAATCPFSPVAANENQLAAALYPQALHASPTLGRYETNYVGHVEEDEFRKNGSSGGMVTWVANELLRKGLIDGVAHVVACNEPHQQGRYFRYRISRSEQEVQQGAKSRYYPIDMSEILAEIRNTPGRYAVVGIPCFIKAVQLLRKKDPLLQERISFTLGLFCGHMKSARFVESFAWQMQVPPQQVQQVEYRYKDANRPANWYNAMLTLNDGKRVNRDWWHLADGDWGAGFFMNNACNYCDDVVSETADIAFGDAWVEPYSSDGRGTNVVVVRLPLMADLLKSAIADGRLQLQEVDAEFVTQTQAAGFRQRREGLAYRLTWLRKGIQPVKRVAPDASGQTPERKKIYRLRFHISAWSHRMFWIARRLGRPRMYVQWARLVASVYNGYAYHGGKWQAIRKRWKELR